MTDIQKWIMQLQSDNPNKRYEACEELRVAPSITDEALDALREVTNDPNELVADAAYRAIDIHTSPSQSIETESKSMPLLYKILISIGLTIIILLGFFVAFALVVLTH